MIAPMPAKDRPISAREGTYPPEEWPVDVMRTDESGDVDLSLIEYNLSLTPTQRVEQHYQFRLFMQELRKAGEKLYGPAVPDPQASE
jgi:hypothetical protein